MEVISIQVHTALVDVSQSFLPKIQIQSHLCSLENALVASHFPKDEVQGPYLTCGTRYFTSCHTSTVLIDFLTHLSQLLPQLRSAPWVPQIFNLLLCLCTEILSPISRTGEPLHIFLTQCRKPRDFSHIAPWILMH